MEIRQKNRLLGLAALLGPALLLLQLGRREPFSLKHPERDPGLPHSGAKVNQESFPWIIEGTLYDQEGRKVLSGAFYNGSPGGEFSFWYGNGQLFAHGFIQRGQRCGWWEFYDAGGSPIPELTGNYLEDEKIGPPPFGEQKIISYPLSVEQLKEAQSGLSEWLKKIEKEHP